jgi:predicted RNase H-like nuclease (RuvC/YqgF family)
MKETTEQIKAQLMEIKEERKRLNAENTKLKQVLNKYRAEIKSLHKKIAELQIGPGPGKNNISGWTLTKSGQYFKLFKKVDGQTKGIHLGRVFDREKAIEKIKAKECVNQRTGNFGLIILIRIFK